MSEQTSADALRVLRRAVDAKGGIEKLRAIRTVRMHGTMIVMVPTPHEAQIINSVAYPDRFRQDAKLQGGEVTQVFASGVSWMKDPSGVHDVPSPARENLAAAVSRDVVTLLVGALQGKLVAQLLPETSPKGGEAASVVRIAAPGAASVDLVVDRKSGLILAKRYMVEQPGSAGVPTEEDYSDYRAVDGVQVAFKTSVRRGAALVLQQTFTRFEINVPLDPALFKRPE